MSKEAEGLHRIRICAAASAEQILAARALFEEYAASLKISLCFQGFAEELANLPGQYAPPRGRLLLAEIAGAAIGCVALRPLSENRCEMKRLFVKPPFRNQGAGRLLACRIVDEARGIGYSSMNLDTLPSMLGAIRLYEALGFKHSTAYYSTPLQETLFMELAL